MRKYLVATVALAVMALAASASPAFTADPSPTGTLTVTVTAQAPAAPCVEFATGPGEPGTEVEFGTLVFSTPALQSLRWSDTMPRFVNCGTAAEKLYIAGTDATNVCSTICVAHTWELAPLPGTPCPTLNTYGLAYGVDAHSNGIFDETNTPLEKSTNPRDRYEPGESHSLNLALTMPCTGSVGAGEQFRLGVTITAAIA